MLANVLDKQIAFMSELILNITVYAGLGLMLRAVLNETYN